MSQIENLSSLASLPSPLTEAPEEEVFTKVQWDILYSILEVFAPSITTESLSVSSTDINNAISRLGRYLPDGASDDDARAFLSEDIISNSAFKETVSRKFKLYVPPADAQGLAFILSTLNTTVGSYLLTGSSSPIHTQDLATRTRIVLSWPNSRLAPLRAVYRAFSSLARFSYVVNSPSIPRILDFPAIPRHIERSDSYAFTFHDFSSASSATTLTTDVVIIGSGCGAGVTASQLSRAGLKCLILEKSYHFASTHFPMDMGTAAEHLMENGGTVVSDDGSTLVLAGSTFGGGGTVNWSASLQPQHGVRKDWASNNLPHFLSSEYQDCLDTVCERMGVARSNDPSALNNIEHNFANQTLLEGARRLGMAVEIVPQNTASKRHHCGYCTYGCASATKQGPANCWFPDAASHGAEFVEGAFVDEITFSPDRTRATGVRATWTSRDRKITRTLNISASRVIVAAGTLHSPAVLQRSGIKNSHIGSNLHLHPSTQVWATWPQRTNPWEGAILTVAVTELDNLDGAHHGAKIEVICSTPGYGLPGVPFRVSKADPTSSAIEYKLAIAKHGFSTGFISIARDTGTGKVYIDPKDPTRKRVRISYTPSERDRKHLLEGQLAGARIAFVMGALEIDTVHPLLDRWIRPSTSVPGGADNEDVDDDEASFTAWRDAARALGISTPDSCMIGSAHQMGTCRMSSSSKTGAVDSKGKVWGVEGLYVADASVFPSASGVNPMVSTMGIAEWISRHIVKDLKGEQRKERPSKL
ncbi:putative long chain fatty alcohol oxidase [Exophiala viscosa]|uniref:Long-chain-alcohol oxidase n=1 Tax=Exophiala viscosa TaxID=2486360 RepID=A0AAN6I9I8_9EURO|nr:putative long chain fatty alcohol oxidase [Exophiala viscosa]